MNNKFKIGILGNLDETYLPHYKMNSCFTEFQDTFNFTFEWIPTEKLEEFDVAILDSYNGIIAGSGPYNSKEGVINGIKYARENHLPFLGTCSGFGYSVLEFGKALFELETVHHPLEGIQTNENQIFLQPLNACGLDMYPITFTPVLGTLTAGIYSKTPDISELSHCHYGISLEMIKHFESAGFLVAGYDEIGEPKIMEYTKNMFFVIALFYPQLNSNRKNPHPLLESFLQAALETII